MRRLLPLLFVLFVLTGCAPKDSVAPNGTSSYDETWRAKSSLSRAQAFAAATTLSTVIADSKVWSVQETHSMEPIIWGNCYLVAEPVKVEDIRPGDIILYKRGSKVILHTCVGNSAGRLTMKGYNNFDGDNQPNQFITQDEVVGRYVGQIVFDPNKP